MAPVPIIRLAGPVSLAAGAVIILTEVVSLLLRTAQDPPALVLLKAVLRLSAFYLLLVGLVGLYARQAEAAGKLGLVGFLGALPGTLLLAGDLWFEAFIVLHLTEVAPQVLAEQPSGVALA